jgi:hypothetical protein
MYTPIFAVFPSHSVELATPEPPDWTKKEMMSRVMKMRVSRRAGMRRMRVLGEEEGRMARMRRVRRR